MRQIINGSDPLVEVEDMSPMDIALKEIAEGMIEPRKFLTQQIPHPLRAHVIMKAH